MKLKTRLKMIVKFLFLTVLNLFNSILIVILYIFLIPFCVFSSSILTDTMKQIKKILFKDDKVDPEALELMKELLIEYRQNVMIYSLNKFKHSSIDILKNPENRWAVNESIKYLAKHNIKVGE